MKKKTLSVLITLGLILNVGSSVFASPSSGAQQLQDVKNQQQNLEIKIEKMDDQIQGTMRQISDNKKNIDKTQKDIVQASKDLEKAQDTIKSQQQLFDKRMRAMYMSGVDSYMDIVLQSKGLSDLISNIEAVKKIIGFDQKVISDLKEKKEVIDDKKEALDLESTKLLALKADNETKLAKLTKDKSDVLKEVASLKQQERMYASAADISSINATMQDIANIRNSAPKLSMSRGAASLSSNYLIAYASNFLGTPYVYGGSSPSGFDCSGFVQYVYAHFGISLPRVASDQQQVGTSVSRNQLQPGDLVFFGYPAYHVGMYVGNGVMIEAPRTGYTVRISSIDRSGYSGAKRVR